VVICSPTFNNKFVELHSAVASEALTEQVDLAIINIEQVSFCSKLAFTDAEINDTEWPSSRDTDALFSPCAEILALNM